MPHSQHLKHVLCHICTFIRSELTMNNTFNVSHFHKHMSDVYLLIIKIMHNQNTFRHTHTHAHMHKHTQPFYSSLDFVHDNPSEPVPEATFTYYYSHISWSSIVPNLLHPFNTIHGILPVQFMRLTVFSHNLSRKFSLVYLLAWHHPLHTPYVNSPNHWVTSLSGSVHG